MTGELYPQIRQLHVNTGGEIDETEVIGREQELDALLRTLERQSVLVAAERRIGKTTLCKQAQRRLSSGTLALYQDIETVNSAGELAEALLEMVYPHLNRWRRGREQSSALYKRLAGFQIILPDFLGGGGVILPPALQAQWKELIQDTVTDLLAAQTGSKHNKGYVCLFLDEFPIAVEKIRVAEGDRIAMDVLDMFRSLREMHGANLRFVFTGSIGIHHIVRRLQKQDYANDPMNDVFSLHVRALKEGDARTLALGLLLGESILSADYEAAAAHIARECCGVPFYIHHTVGALRDEGLEATGETIENVIEGCIVSPLDPWKLRHYRTRLERHFPDTRLIAFALLDALAVSESPCDFPTLCNRVSLKITDTNEESIGETLDLLEQDFYVERDAQNQTYRFLRPLLARAWRHIQRLPNLNARA